MYLVHCNNAAGDSAQIAMDKRNMYLSADSTFALVTQKLPDWPYGYYWRASALYNAYDKQENIDKGISAPYYLKLAELAEKDPDPSKYKSYLKLAYNYLAFYSQTTLKDEAKAKEYWTKLLAIDPNSAAAKEALGMAPAPAAAAATATPAKAAPAKKPAPKKIIRGLSKIKRKDPPISAGLFVFINIKLQWISPV